MFRYLQMHEARTAHARMVRRLTGTNDYRDKEIHFRMCGFTQCLSTSQVIDNMVCYQFR